MASEVATYTYILSDVLPDIRVHSETLTKEIARTPSITTALDRVIVGGNTLYVTFRGTLSTDEEDALAKVISTHQGKSTEMDFSYTKIVEEKNHHLINDKFMAEGMILDTTNQGWNSKDFSWPINISALSYEFAAGAEHVNDLIEIEVAPDTTVGALTADVAIGDTVLHVSPSVFTFMKRGYYAHLSDGVQAQERLGRCVDVDAAAGTVTVELASTKAFAAATPTVVQISAYVTRNLVIYQPGRYVVGESKIGGTLVPKDRIVRMWYYNADGASKNFAVHFDYLF